MSFANAFNLDKSKTLLFNNRLVIQSLYGKIGILWVNNNMYSDLHCKMRHGDSPNLSLPERGRASQEI